MLVWFWLVDMIVSWSAMGDWGCWRSHWIMITLKLAQSSQAADVEPWERAMIGEFLRKASKDLMPSESPFFSLKALSSSPWSAKPFIRTPCAHRAFGVAGNAYSSAFNEFKDYNLEDDSEAILRHWRTALRTSRHAAKS